MAIVNQSAATRDLQRFLTFREDGVPGPYFYVVLLGLKSFDLPSLMKHVEGGFSFSVIEHLKRNSALEMIDLLSVLNIPPRTLTRRKAEGRFTPDESDRIVRFTRLLGKTIALFEGDNDAAARFLKKPQRGLGGVIPLELARTDFGSREVETLVERLEYGVLP